MRIAFPFANPFSTPRKKCLRAGATPASKEKQQFIINSINILDIKQIQLNQTQYVISHSHLHN